MVFARPVNPVAFLPLLLLGIERAYAAAASGQRGGWWLISVAGSLSFYGGFPEVTYIDTLMAICWFGWRAGCLASRKHLMAFVGKSASGLGVATLLSAPLLAAMASDFAQADLGANGASSTFGSMHLSGLALPQLLLPYIYGPIFGSADPEHVLTGIWGAVGGYLTTSLALFALLGLFSKQRRGLRLILFTWTVLVFARMYGEPHVLSGILGALPYMSRVAFFRYATPSLELSVIVLAALGIDDLVAVAQRRRRVVAGALAIGALVTLAVLKARTLAAQLPEAAAHRLIL